MSTFQATILLIIVTFGFCNLDVDLMRISRALEQANNIAEAHNH